MMVLMSDRLAQYRADPLGANRSIIDAFRAHNGKPPGFTRLLLLTTTGARTGEPRTTPVGYATDGDHLLLWASNMAAPRDPAWFRNLVANPEVTVELGDETFRARATVSQGEERARVVKVLTDQMPVGSHQDQVEREIPVVILERIG
jgi:deazaflavin-dependent oxidoreductase (nitroreductase family)